MTVFKMDCPFCKIPMVVGELTPGDRIAKCPRCKALIDLPDGDEAVVTPVNARVVSRSFSVKGDLPDSGDKESILKLLKDSGLDLGLNDDQLSTLMHEGHLEVSDTGTQNPRTPVYNNPVPGEVSLNGEKVGKTGFFDKLFKKK